MRLGLMGGTFDPIHIGHLFIAEEARVRCGLQSVLFFPNHQPAHREGKTAHADPEIRWQLVRAAIADNPHFVASRVELDRPGPSYAYDTLRTLQAEYGPHTELCYIVGADSIGAVPTWHRGDELFQLCQFIALTRPGSDLSAAQQALTPAQRARVTWLDSPPLDIASRDLRRRVQEGEPIRYLVPPAVERVIEDARLYRENGNAVKYEPEARTASQIQL